MTLPLAFSATPAAAPAAAPAGPCTAAGAATLERLRHWPGDHQVVVGLTGGVDSFLMAALLVEAGRRVEGSPAC